MQLPSRGDTWHFELLWGLVFRVPKTLNPKEVLCMGKLLHMRASC